MRFMIIPVLQGSATPQAADAPFDEALFAAYMKFNEDMHKAGVLVASEGLNPAAPSAHISVAKGKRTVLDGPFAETKELVAGFWLVDVTSKAEAVEWALRAPINPAGDEIIEIRPLTGSDDIPEMLLQIAARSAPEWTKSWQAQEDAVKKRSP